MTNIKNTQPKLRFNGINYEIAYLKLKSFSVVKCGKTPSTKNELFWLNGTIPFVTPTDIINARINKTERFVTTEGLKKSQKAIAGSVFVTCVASIGKNSMCDTDSAFNQQINNIYSNIYNNKYLYYLMNKNEQLIKSKASKSATQIIKKSDFENIEFHLTTDIKEQIKIANFFTILDKQIQLMERKLELYELKKKYYLNNMLCSLTESIPNIKFEKSDDIYLGYSLFYNTSTRTQKIPYLEIQEASIGSRGMVLKEEIYKNGTNVKDTHMCRVSQPLDLVIGMGSKKIDICINKFNFNVGISTAYYSYEIRNINQKYFNLCLERNISHLSNLYMIISARQGKSVNKDGLFKQVFTIHSLDEQTKIANLFSSLDESIQNLKKQKDQLTKRKTYYLNNMFI